MNHESRIKNQGRLKTIIRNSLFMIPSRGFTLLELIIVIALIGIMTGISIVGLNDYTRTARLNAAANGLITTLNVAKSNALSQVKDETLCAGSVLEGYKLVVNSDCKTYDLKVVCGGADLQVGNTKTLPNNVEFTIPAPVSFLFPVLKGGAIMSGSGTIKLSGFGKAECIRVDSQGVISGHQQPCLPSSCIP